MIEWVGDAAVSQGVAERAFVLHREGDAVSGLFWRPEAPGGPVPLVLAAHGAHLHKRVPYVLALARRLARRNGIAVVSLDAIEHGDRGPIRPPNDPRYAELLARPESTDRMIADWKAALDLFTAMPEIDGDRLGYWGLSLGTILGLPFVASEPRIKAAVLGLCGLTGSSAERAKLGSRHRTDAPGVTCPVMFMVQWNDELFDRDGCFALFDIIGATDKRLHANMGLHAEVSAEEVDQTREFLAARI